MPGTYSQILLHIVFSTKHREPWITPDVAERLFRERGPKDNHDSELRHKATIDRFGRYPHRNAVLGRESTEEELAFLAGPGSSF